MEDTKPLLASLTVRMGIATILSGVAMVAQGWATDPTDFSIITNGVVTIVTGFGVIYGRERATKLIS